jgi:arylsulfatase A-like enzyme
MSRIIGILVAALVAGTAGTTGAPVAANDTRPSFVVVTADDMRFDDLRYMPHTRKLLGQLRLQQFISNHPLCCPARAEILTGQFAQKNGVFHNTPPFGGYGALVEPDNTLASWLFDAGYHTGFVGKFVNHWNPHEGSMRPYGWTDFNAWMGQQYSPYDWTDFNDGDAPVKPGTHTNDGVTQKTVQRIEEYGTDPFFIWASYIAPHPMTYEAGVWGRPVPAERHAGMFANVQPPYQDKPSFSYPAKRARTLAETWRQRIESLQSVDEGVRDIVETLRSTGQLDNTVVAFFSDNGYLLGEHRAKGKNLPWEESLRVPFLARGPGVGSGKTVKEAMITDLAPSIAALAGVAPGRDVDGRDDLFSAEGGWRNMPIQAGADDPTLHFRWRGLRTARWTYVHWIDGRKELYDRSRDPYQLSNLAGKRPKVQRRLAAQTPAPY